MTYTVKEVVTEDDYRIFTELPFKIYKDNPYWVAPIRKDYRKYIHGKDNDLGHCPHKLFLVFGGEEALGRILAYVDEELNEVHGLKVGYLGEYEAVDEEEVATLLLDAAVDFLKSRGMTLVKGPVSLPSGEDHRGFMINGFDRMPSIMNTYNLSYYNAQWEKYGFRKYHDCYAFGAEKKDLEGKVKRLRELLPKVKERYGFRVDTVDLKNHLERDLEDIYQVLKEALPSEWEDFKPVTKEEIQGIFSQVKPFVDEDLVAIAREKGGRPIGFNLALPDYNEILHGFHGKLGPWQILQFLWKRKSIKRIRMFVMFVIPEYHKRGVSSAIYFTCFENGVRKGYEYLEGSTIWDYNHPMLADIEKFGARPTITYRIYQKEI